MKVVNFLGDGFSLPGGTAHSGRFGLGNRCQMTCQKRERQGPVRRHGTVVSSAGRDGEVE